MPRRFHRPAVDGGFLLPLAASTSMLLVLSSLSLQAAALQARSQVQGDQRLRQAEDALMSAAQHWVGQRLLTGELADGALEGQTGRVGSVAYRLVAWEAPRWPEPAGLDGLQHSQALATFELLPTAEQPRPLQAAFGLDLAQPVAPAAGGVRVLALRELGLRGRAAQGVAP